MSPVKKTLTKNPQKIGNLLFGHQLTPALTATKWSLKMLLDGDFGSVNQEQKDILEKLIQKNDGLIALVNKLLHLAKLEEGKYTYQFAKNSLEEIVGKVMHDSQEESAKKNISIALMRPEALPRVMVDGEMVQMAVQNLVDNALKYSPVNGSVVISLLAKKKEVEIQIKDSGIGIPKHQEGKLFGKFFRADNVNKSNESGSGLGLFIAKSIMEAHKGKIWFESEENKGTTFYLDFPVS